MKQGRKRGKGAVMSQLVLQLFDDESICVPLPVLAHEKADATYNPIFNKGERVMAIEDQGALEIIKGAHYIVYKSYRLGGGQRMILAHEASTQRFIRNPLPACHFKRVPRDE